MIQEHRRIKGAKNRSTCSSRWVKKRVAKQAVLKKKKKKLSSFILVAGVICCAGFLLMGLFSPTGAHHKKQDFVYNTCATDAQEVKDDTIITGGNTIETHSWNLVLINRENPLPAGFSVKLLPLGCHQFDARALNALEEMLDGARAEGLSPLVCSSYRSIEVQAALYEDQMQQHIARGYTPEEAERIAGTIVAYPGTSEHNAGLAVDIVAQSYQLLEEDQEETRESVWLHANCHTFGFILRYPKDKQDSTGIIYEPWHYRYVGVEAATEIKERGVSLEEYLKG